VAKGQTRSGEDVEAMTVLTWKLWTCRHMTRPAMMKYPAPINSNLPHNVRLNLPSHSVCRGKVTERCKQFERSSKVGKGRSNHLFVK
jgi:hypothetical protein